MSMQNAEVGFTDLERAFPTFRGEICHIRPLQKMNDHKGRGFCASYQGLPHQSASSQSTYHNGTALKVQPSMVS